MLSSETRCRFWLQTLQHSSHSVLNSIKFGHRHELWRGQGEFHFEDQFCAFAKPSHRPCFRYAWSHSQDWVSFGLEAQLYVLCGATSEFTLRRKHDEERKGWWEINLPELLKDAQWTHQHLLLNWERKRYGNSDSRLWVRAKWDDAIAILGNS